MKKILVACGAGIATSTVAISKLKGILTEKGMLDKVSLGQCTIAELPSKASGYDLVITTSNFTKDLGVPVVKGLSFITNIGINKTIDDIIEKLGL